MDFDLHNLTTVLNALKIDTIASDTTTVGETIDTQDATLGPAHAIEFLIQMGTVTDGDYAWQMFHSDDSGMSGEVQVTTSALGLLGTMPAYTADTDDDKVARVGYIGKLRYLRLKVVSTNFSSAGAVMGATAVRAKHATVPTPAQFT